MQDNQSEGLKTPEHYVRYELPNKIKVLLISEPKTIISAVCLSVAVGSMSDPPYLQGTAHLLEHMLFKGSEKYPEENDFHKFISQHGGDRNASTTLDSTQYHFTVESGYLEPALDRFVQFFIAPLMLDQSIDLEMEAVNSEFTRNLEHDHRRMSRMIQVLSEPNHDYRKFSSGNHQSLRDEATKLKISIRDALFAFFHQNYSANRMCLCVLGKDPLARISLMVEFLFSSIPNYDLKILKWTHPYTASEKSLMKKVFIVPLKRIESMSIVFAFPDVIQHYKSWPIGYLLHLFRYQGKGSLNDELANQGLGLISNITYERINGFGLFHIKIQLHDNKKQIDQIAVIIFQYIKLIKSEGPKEFIYKEIRNLEILQQKSVELNIDFVIRIASSMHHKFDGIKLCVDKYQPKLISKLIDYLKPTNCSILVCSKTFASKANLKEPFFNIQYTIEPFTSDLIDKLCNCALNERIQLPLSNILVPKSSELEKDIDNNYNVASQIDNQDCPTLIRNTQWLKVWYLKNETTSKGLVFYSIKVINPIVNRSPINWNTWVMFSRLFQNSLCDLRFKSKLANLEFNMVGANYGFQIEFFGRSSGMDEFFSHVLHLLATFKVDISSPMLFFELKDKQKKNLKSFKRKALLELAKYNLELVISEMKWSYEELIAAMDCITLDSICSMQKALFSNFSVEAFVHGNVGKSRADIVCDLIEKDFVNIFKPVPMAKHSHSLPRRVKLEPGCSFYWTVDIADRMQQAILVYFQVCLNEPQSVAKLQLINRILREPFYAEMRNKQQLGYTVKCNLDFGSGVVGMTFAIVSPSNPDYLDCRIEAFLLWAHKYMLEMKNEQFEREKNSLLTRLFSPKNHFIATSQKLWTQIKQEKTSFHFERQNLEEIKKTTKEEVVQLFKESFTHGGTNRRKLQIHIRATDISNNLKGMLAQSTSKTRSTAIQIENYQTFKKYKYLLELV